MPIDRTARTIHRKTLDELKDLLLPEQVAILETELARAEYEKVSHQEDVDVSDIRAIWEKLGYEGVWGPEGYQTFFLNINGKLLLFQFRPDPETDFVSPDALMREFKVCSSIDDLISDIVLHLRGRRELDNVRDLTIIPEDHPETRCLGFTCLQDNKVWMINVDEAIACLDAGRCSYPDAGILIQANAGRVELSQRLEANLVEYVPPQKAQPVPRLMGADTAFPDRKKNNEIMIDLTSCALGKAYMERYHPKKGQE